MMSLIEKIKVRRRYSKAVAEEKIMTSRANKSKVKFSKKKLIAEILFEARVLNRHLGAAKIIAEKVADEVEKWADERSFVTEDDITQVASKKIAKYDKDLAYIFKNRGKII